MKYWLLSICVCLTVVISCDRDARVASRNLSYSADNFEIFRRVIFYNGITDNYLLSIEGYCSIEVDSRDHQLEVVCRDNLNGYKKHFLGLSDNVTYFIEQLEPAKVGTQFYKVSFKPSVIIPSIEFN